MRILEVPLDSIESAILAAPFADRLELCDDLSSEGWTPSMALVRAAAECVDPARTQVVSMIRPRSMTNSDKLDVAAFATTRASSRTRCARSRRVRRQGRMRSRSGC